MSLTDDELADYRAVQEAHLPSLATVENMTRSQDATGATVESYAAASGTVPARRGLATRAELVLTFGDRWASDPRLTVTVPWNAAVDVEDRITLEGVTYLVVGHLSQSSWETAKRLAVVEAE